MLGTPELGLPVRSPYARCLHHVAPWPSPGNGWQACPVSAAPGLTQPGFTVEYQGRPPPQDVPSTCLVLRPEQLSGWPGHRPFTHGAHCVWPGSGNSLMVSTPLWGRQSLPQPCAQSAPAPNLTAFSQTAGVGWPSAPSRTSPACWRGSREDTSQPTRGQRVVWAVAATRSSLR